ncbi:DUF3846 domain-containing protein [Amycolatopsis sp. NPDC003861]
MTGIPVLLITPLGDITDEVIGTEEDGSTLSGMYRLIECQTVSVVSLKGGFDMWVDDEGVLNGSIPNPFATFVAVLLGAPPQYYFGNALFAGFDTEGNTTCLTDDQRAVIHSALSEIMSGDLP